MKRYRLLFFALASTLSITITSAQTLTERLGYDKDAILLIVNNDDAGMCHAANSGTIKGMQDGLITSATIMFICPWANEIVNFAKNNPDKGFGVHLTLTSEWKNYKWGPISPLAQVPGLADTNGYLWASVEEVYQHGTAEQAYTEGKAQIERALAQGVPITHIDSHMGTYQLHPAYFEQYVRLAVEFNLPLRMASQATTEKFGQGHIRDKCKEAGLVFTDYLIYDELRDYHEVEDFWVKIIDDLKPGVTELFLHASELTPELRATTGTAQKRAEELEVFTNSAKIKEALARKNVQLISYKPLLELQRQSRK